MKTRLDNLPKLKRLEFERVVEVLRQSFAEAADRLRTVWPHEARFESGASNCCAPLMSKRAILGTIGSALKSWLGSRKGWRPFARRSVPFARNGLSACRRRPAISPVNPYWPTFELPDPSRAFDG